LLFWDVTERRLLTSDVSGKSFDRPATSVTINQGRVTSQKSKDLIYSATEAWSHAL